MQHRLNPPLVHNQGNYSLSQIKENKKNKYIKDESTKKWVFSVVEFVLRS